MHTWAPRGQSRLNCIHDIVNSTSLKMNTKHKRSHPLTETCPNRLNDLLHPYLKQLLPNEAASLRPIHTLTLSTSRPSHHQSCKQRFTNTLPNFPTNTLSPAPPGPRRDPIVRLHVGLQRPTQSLDSRGKKKRTKGEVCALPS